MSGELCIEITRFFIGHCSLENHDRILALILEIDQLLLNDNSCVRFMRLKNLTGFLAVQEVHRIELRYTRHSGDAICKAVTNNNWHGRKCLEVFIVLICEFEVLPIQWIVLETNTESIQYHISLCHRLFPS